MQDLGGMLEMIIAVGMGCGIIVWRIFFTNAYDKPKSKEVDK